MEKQIEKANVLIEALPYIKRFHGKTVIIKYGGRLLEEETMKRNAVLDIVLMKYVGINPVLVHGGGAAISATMKKMGKQPSFVHGMRLTDKETIEIVEMVLVGKINRELVALLNESGGKAVGLSGKDGGMIKARKHQPVDKDDNPLDIDLGFVGDVEEINPKLVELLDSREFIPVIAPLGVGEKGETYNINADQVAGALAACLPAEKIVLVTDVPGIMRHPEDPESLMSTLTVKQAEELIKKGIVAEGMIPKVKAGLRALAAGVRKCHVIDGRVSHCLLLEIFTDEGIGTEIIA